MEIDAYIKHCNLRISQIWKLIQDLEADGLPPDSPTFDILAEKAEYWINLLETVGQENPATRLVTEVTDLVWN